MGFVLKINKDSVERKKDRNTAERIGTGRMVRNSLYASIFMQAKSTWEALTVDIAVTAPKISSFFFSNTLYGFVCV